jgi:molecular chaperone GrpE
MMTDETENQNGSGQDNTPLDEAEMLRGEVAELKDRLLRALADVENIRRRSERE